MHSLAFFSLLWARVALALYVAGLAAAIAAALSPRRADLLFGMARAAVASGFLFQFVGLVEMLALGAPVAFNFYRLVTLLLAFVIAAFFLMVYRLYSPRSLSLVVLPLVCALTAAAAISPLAQTGGAVAGPSPLARSLLHNGWIFLHIVLIFIGYAGLVVAMGSGVLYLLAERSLKAKAQSTGRRLQLPLETLDQLAYRSLLVGFPLLTAGLVIGVYWADALFGRISLSDPTVLLALLAWAIYLVLLFARWSGGWRGRRSAYLTLVCFAVALAGWLANGASFVHSMFLR